MAFLNSGGYMGVEAFKKTSGSATGILGPMFSGKTSELFRIRDCLASVNPADAFICIKPKLDEGRVITPPALLPAPLVRKNSSHQRSMDLRSPPGMESSVRGVIPYSPRGPLEGKDRGASNLKCEITLNQTAEYDNGVDDTQIVAPIPRDASPCFFRQEMLETMVAGLVDSPIRGEDTSHSQDKLLSLTVRPKNPPTFSDTWSPSPPLSPIPMIYESFIQTHSHQRVSAFATDNLMNMVQTQWFVDATYVFIDEGQFFEDLKEFVFTCKCHNKHVFIAALNGDFKQCAFTPVTDTIPICTDIRLLHGVCMKCKAAPSSFTILNEETAPPVGQILVGGSDKYLAVCDRCLFQFSAHEEELKLLDTRCHVPPWKKASLTPPPSGRLPSPIPPPRSPISPVFLSTSTCLPGRVSPLVRTIGRTSGQQRQDSRNIETNGWGKGSGPSKKPKSRCKHKGGCTGTEKNSSFSSLSNPSAMRKLDFDVPCP